MSGEDYCVFSGERGLRFRESLKGFGEGKAVATAENSAFDKEQRESLKTSPTPLAKVRIESNS
jgi:hypothetical protein